MNATEFKKLALIQRYNLVKNDGIHIASREFGGYWVHLFSLESLFIEVWVLIGLNQIRWIETQENQHTIDLYIDKMDISTLFK
jgi:hypothetical protein